MPYAAQPEDRGRIFAEFDRRLRTIETSNRLQNASLDRGAIRVLDTSSEAGGSPRVVFGEQADGTLGVWIYDETGENVIVRLGPEGLSTFDPGDGLPRQVSGVFSNGEETFTGWVLYDGDGRSVLMTRNDKPGLVKPDIPAPFRNTADEVLVTSATFVETHRFDPRRMYHDVLQLDVFVRATGVSTAGEVRLKELNSGSVTSSVTIPAGGSGHALFDWLHGAQIGDDPGEAIYFTLEARRTAGTLEIGVRVPDAVMTSSALVPDADTAGHARWA